MQLTHRNNTPGGLRILLFILLSIVLPMMLYFSNTLGIVTEEGYINCHEILVEVEMGVYLDICKSFRPDSMGV